MGVVWTKRNGQEIPVERMTDAHLRNTINFLERVAIKRFWRKVGAMNGDPAKGGQDQFMIIKPGPPFDDMVAECRARGGALRRWAEEFWDDVHMPGDFHGQTWEERLRLYREDHGLQFSKDMAKTWGCTEAEAAARLRVGPWPYPTKPGVRPACAKCGTG